MVRGGRGLPPATAAQLEKTLLLHVVLARTEGLPFVSLVLQI